MKSTTVLEAMKLGAWVKQEGSENSIYEVFQAIKQLRKISRKYHRLCEYDCNGEGYLNGRLYKADQPEYYTKDNENTIWYIELDKLDAKIVAITMSIGCDVKTQRDPRGCEIKISYKGYDFTSLIY